ncbi:MAG: hypothetical protein JSW07_04325 [bacterium]|nr:MAG: hypothetical protein JSW07_04325 [bacterium]
MARAIQISKYLILSDKILGLRAWGLILYGALPSNLALLGAIKVELKIDNISNLLPLFIPASMLPLFITFLLIRSRHKDWYLTKNYLNLRSMISTFIILMLATLICYISLTIRNEPGQEIYQVISRAFLLAIISLVVSSTFFMAILTKEVNLPGIPSKDFVELTTTMRNNLRKIKNNDIWKAYVSLANNNLINLAEKIKDDVEKASIQAENYFIKKSLEPMAKDINNLIEILGEINEGGIQRWKIYFADSEMLSVPDKQFRESQKEKFFSVERIKGLKLGDKYA